MNFQTARLYALNRHPIARAAWGTTETTDSDPVDTATKWVTLEGGIWFVHTEAGGKQVVNSDDAPNLTAEDLLANDWILPPACADVPEFTSAPDFPTNNTNNITPPMDVNKPPCIV